MLVFGALPLWMRASGGAIQGYIERARHSHGYTKVFRFGKAGHAFVVRPAVAIGPRGDMWCLERVLIRMVSPSANARYTSVKGWRHQVVHGAPTSAPRRRPPPRREPRTAPWPYSEPSRTSRMLCAGVPATEPSQQTGTRRPHFETAFSEAYDTFRGVHLNGVEGPVSTIGPEFVDLHRSLLCAAAPVLSHGSSCVGGTPSDISTAWASICSTCIGCGVTEVCARAFHHVVCVPHQ